MSEVMGKQTIGCEVDQCQHWDNRYCELNRIEVGKCSYSDGHQTLCNSFEEK